MTRSEKMLNAALAYQKAVKFMHVPLPTLSKANLTGEHWKILEKTVPIVNRMTSEMHT